ncbi:MAG: pantoate--beta-alanine ligase [Candidatus Omnitrophota bacterium]
MKIISFPRQMQMISSGIRRKGESIGFVPTMGALHDGHISLIRKARSENNTVVVSIFVNPSQFSPKEDFKCYPRVIKKDSFICKKEGVDFIFYPSIKQMYPEGYRTYVSSEGLSNLLCGKSRPVHFKGVATVVAKLFNIVCPDNAYFGQKDAQQAVIVKRMVEDLNIPVKIKALPIIRQKNGLALSSRNVYLNDKEKQDALVLSQSLNLAKSLIKAGVVNADKIIKIMKQLILKKKTAKIDYVSIVNLNDLKPVKQVSGNCLIVLAVYIGKTRLIDNVIIKP